MKKYFKLLFLFILICFCFINVNASTETFDRTQVSNYGVNKKWNINDKNIDDVLATPLVDSSEKIYDFSDILTDKEEATIYTRIMNFIENTGYDFAIVTNNIVYGSDYINEEYASNFYDYNDFGLNKEKYDGIVFFRNTYESDPYYSLYFFGNTQLMYDSSRYNFVLDSIYDDISSHNYLNGILNMIDLLENYYNTGIPSDMENMYLDDNGILHTKFVLPYFTAFIIALVVAGGYVGLKLYKNKMVKKATKASDYLDQNSVKYLGQYDHFIRSQTTSYSTSSSSGGSGGGSSIGSSGGGHSGGGRHG